MRAKRFLFILLGTTLCLITAVRCGPGQVIPYAPNYVPTAQQPGQARPGVTPTASPAATRQQIDQLTRQRARHQADMEDAGAAIGSIDNEIASLEQRAAAIPSQVLEQRRANLTRQSATALENQADKIQLDSTLADLRADVDQRQRAVGELSKEVNRLQALGMVTDELKQAEARLAQASQDLAASQARYFDAQQAARQNMLATTASQFSEKESELRLSQSMEEALTQVQQQSAQLKEQRQARQAEQDRLKGELAKIDQELAQYRS